MLTTAAPDNLNFLFKLLTENDVKGVYLYGGPSWSQEAMGNYIQAKMLWDPSLDASELQHEWLKRAYGPAAGAVMEKLYNKMDNGAFAEFFRQDPSQHYNVREIMFKDYYAPHYAEIEKLFLEAKAQPMTEAQKERLNLIEQNLVVLQWRLKNAGYLPAGFNSPLTRSDETVAQLITAEYDDFQRFPGTVYPAGINKKGLYTGSDKEMSGVSPTKVQLSKEATPTNESKSLPNSDRILLYTSRKENLQLKFSKVQPGSSFLSYRITVAEDGTDIQSGILYSGKTVEIPARASTAYYLTITPTGISGPKVKWDLFVPGAALAEASLEGDTVRLHGKEAPVCIYVPSDFLQETRESTSGVSLISPLTAEEQIAEKYPNTRTLENLNEGWRFQPDREKTGLEQGFARPGFDDASWKTVTATAQWQKQGFPDHQGTSWYRKSFELPDINDDPLGVNRQNLLLFFGGVDGDAVVYVNGEKVGEHLLGKNYQGWDEPFVIDITKQVNPGKNLVAVQVTKEKLAGGIFQGVSLQLEEK